MLSLFFRFFLRSTELCAGRLAVGVLALACSRHVRRITQLMRIPALYTGPNASPLFAETPLPALPPTLDLLFVTDRAPAHDPGDPPYTAGRSRSIAFGSAMVESVKGLTSSTSSQRKVSWRPCTHRRYDSALEQRQSSVDFQRYRMSLRAPGTDMRRPPERSWTRTNERNDGCKPRWLRRLASAPRKEVVLFVHGYNASFERPPR